MKIQTDKCESKSLDYVNWRTNKKGHVALTEWPNGEGLSAEIFDGDQAYSLSLYSDAWAVLCGLVSLFHVEGT